MSSRGHTVIFNVWPLFFLLVAVFLPLSSFASPSSPYIQKARELKLSDDPLWRSLLHFKGNRSKILENDFFLSERGKFDPEAELEATIEAYFSKQHSIKRPSGDQDIVCIFPARYMWLNQKLGLPEYRDDAGVCPALNDWARLNQIESISVLYVSGYLGNPASSFGHVLLNLKIKNSDDLMGLFDTSISYGATVPLNENVLLYISKGLFGGYYATFSDKLFYAHDQVYSNREFRDMWEYRLNLSDNDRKMMIYHIAELLTKRYRYFFLSSNCAQRMAVLLDIFINEKVYTAYPIYVPEELLQQLQRIDKERRLADQPGLIKNITYIPSARRHLYYETRNLSEQEKSVYRNIIRAREEDIHTKLQAVDEQSRIRVLDALLAYQYYKLMASDEEKVNLRFEEYKNKILLERLMLPAEKEKPLDIPEVPSPRDVSPPSSWSIGFVAQKGKKSFTKLGATVFRKESVGLNAMEFNDLVALDLDLGIRREDEAVFVDKFDLLRLKDFKTFYLEEANESPFSWRVRAGMDRYDVDEDLSYDFLLDGGAGLVKKTGNIGIGYVFFNGALHTRDPQYRFGPAAGFVLGEKTPFKLQMDYALELGLEDFDYEPKWEGKAQYQINKKSAVQLAGEKSDRERMSVSYIYFW